MLINLLRLPEPSHITGECTHLARRAVLGAGWAAGDGGLRLNVTLSSYIMIDGEISLPAPLGSERPTNGD